MIQSAAALTTVCSALESSACIIYKVMCVSDKLRQMTTTIKEIIMWAGLAFIEKDQIPILRYDTLYVNKIAQTILNSILG